MNENFLKSDHPAVARTKPRLLSPFPVSNRTFASRSPPVGLTSSPLSPPYQGQRLGEPDTQEVINSFNEYIIPIPDPKPDEVFTDVPSESPARYGTKRWSKHKRCTGDKYVPASPEQVYFSPHHTTTHPDVELRQWLYYVGGN